MCFLWIKEFFVYLVSFDFYCPSKCGSYFCRTLYYESNKNNPILPPYLFQTLISALSSQVSQVVPVSSWQSEHSNPSRGKYKNQCSYTSTQHVCQHGTYWDNFILPLPQTYVHISQDVTSFLVLLRNISIHYLPVTCTLHEPFSSSALIQLH